MKCAIVQSNYIPWRGYFDLISKVDHFILYDDCQYTRQDWRNRNRIKTPQGLQWLSVPVEAKGRPAIKDVKIAEGRWAEKHWRAMEQNYRKAEHFKEYAALLEAIYLARHISLSELNRSFITSICAILGIRTRISSSMDYELVDGRNERLVGLCKAVGADTYISGPAAKCYLDRTFEDAGVKVEFMEYNYPEYRQLYGKFEHGVSVLDLIFNEGPNARSFM